MKMSHEFADTIYSPLVKVFDFNSGECVDTLHCANKAQRYMLGNDYDGHTVVFMQNVINWVDGEAVPVLNIHMIFD